MKLKKSELIFSTILLPIDYLILVITGILIYDLRQNEFVTDIQPLFYDLYSLPFTTYLEWIILLAFLFIGIFWLLGLYQIKSTRKFPQDVIKVILGISIGFAFIVFAAFLDQSLIAPRFFVIIGWLLSSLLVLIGRLSIYLIQGYLLVKKKYGIHRLLIVGAEDDQTKELVDTIKKNPQKGFEIVKIVKRVNKGSLEKIYKNTPIDEIVLTQPNRPLQQIKDLVDFADEYKISYKYIPSDLQAKMGKIKMDTFLNFPIIEIERTPLEGWGRVIKRLIDVVGSLVGIVLFSPIMLMSAIVIKLNSKGPVIADIPPRAGQNGNPFKCYKFRSMYVGAHKDQKKLTSDREGIFKAKNDPRITSVGKIIRKTSIDEFPQFFNVLKGDMSLVGPRPHFLNEYKKEHKKVWTIKPGMTGLPQTSGRSDLSFEDEVKLDTYYIENWSLWLDIIILIKTFFVLFKDREAE